MSKKVGQSGYYYPKNYQQAHISNSHTAAVPRDHYHSKRADVPYSVSGGVGGNRGPQQHQYTSVSGPHPPGSNSSLQPSSQSAQLRGSGASHLSSHNPLTSIGVPHSQQHHPAHHSALHQHHQPLSSAHSGAAVNLVQSNVAPGISSAQVGGPSPHDLNAQGIQQASQQTLPAGVALPGSVPGPPAMMFSSGTPTGHLQTLPNNQQVFNYGTPAHIHLGGPRQAIAHQNVQGYGPTYATMVPHPHFAQYSMGSNRPGIPGGQASYQPMPPQHYQFPYLATPQVYYPQQPKPAPAPPQRTRNVIEIIDPATNKNIFEGMSNPPTSDYTPSPTFSRDSSASNTPAPNDNALSESQAIIANFALEVAVRADKSPPAVQRLNSEVNNALEFQSNDVMMSINDDRSNVSTISGQNAESVPPNNLNTAAKVVSPTPNQTPLEQPPLPQRPPKQSKHPSQPTPPPANVAPPNLPKSFSNAPLSPPKSTQIQSATVPNQHLQPAQVVVPKNVAVSQAPLTSSSVKQPSPIQAKVSHGQNKSAPSTPQNTVDTSHQGKGGALPPASSVPSKRSESPRQSPASSKQNSKVDGETPVAMTISHHQMQQIQQQQVSQLPSPQQVQNNVSKSSQLAHNTGSKSKSPVPPNGPEASTKSTSRSSSAGGTSAKGDKRSPNTQQATSGYSNASSKESTVSAKPEIKKEATESSAGKRSGKDKKQESKEAPVLPANKVATGAKNVPDASAASPVTGRDSKKISNEAPSVAKPEKVADPEPAPISASTSTSQTLPDAAPAPKEDSPVPSASPIAPKQHDPASVASANRGTQPQANHVADIPAEANHVPEPPSSSSLNEKVSVPNVDVVDGKRQYGRDLLLQLRDSPISTKRPDFLPDIEVVLNGPINRSSDVKTPKVMSDFTPAFLQTPNNRNRGSPYGNPKMCGGNRGSQQNKKTPRIIDIKLTASADVKLKTAKNAWKPSNKTEDEGIDVDDERTTHEKTIKKMRGILNKLTPDNFRRLVDQVKALKVTRRETFDELIGIVFEKAVDEQAFSATYANLCNVLSKMSLKSQENGDDTMFRNLIITKCQTEFEKDSDIELRRAERNKKIAEATDMEEKEELISMLNYDEMQLRRRSVGNVRFIGELYKRKMLNSNTLLRIIRGLIDKGDEESLECMCKCITTVGEMLDSSIRASNKQEPKDCWDKAFDDISKLIRLKSTSSRVRFLMMDVLDLKEHNWVPRREQANPKSKAQVHEEIRKEALEQQYLLSNTPRKDDRDMKRRGGPRDNRMGGPCPEESWNIVNARRGPFDPSRLKSNTFNRTNAENNVSLRAHYSGWARGSSGGGKEEEENLRLSNSNRFSVLDNHSSQQQLSPSDIRRSNIVGPRLAPGGGSGPHHHRGMTSFGSKSMPGPTEKDNLLSSVKGMSSLGDRSKSNSRASSRDSSLVREMRYDRPPPPPLAIAPLEFEQAMNFTKSIHEEFIANSDLQEANECVLQHFKGNNMTQFVLCTLEWVVDRSSSERSKVGILLHHFMSHKIISVQQFIEGSKDVMESMPDLIIDVPQVYSNMGDLLSYLLTLNVCTIRDVLTVLGPADSGCVPIFTEFIKQASKRLGMNVVEEMWAQSGLNWKYILPSDENVENYLSKHNLSFLHDATKRGLTNRKTVSFNPSEVQTDLMKLFQYDALEDNIFEWIEINVGKETKTKEFIRALTTALIESLLIVEPSNCKACENFDNKLKVRSKFIKKFVDGNSDLEIQCVYAMQALMVRMEHPNKVLERCFRIFYDTDSLSEEAFTDWETTENPEELAGRGVCLSSTRQFFVTLKADQSV